jgi:hypothetical protein
MTSIRRPARPGEAAGRRRPAALIALCIVLLVGAACTKDKKEPTPSTSATTPTTAESTTTTAPLTKEQIVLGADGVGAVKFGTNSAHTIARFMQALGQPDKNTPLPAGGACGATRRLHWANFQVLVNEVVSTAGAGKPGFAGWFLGPAATGTAPSGMGYDFRTEKGIGVGSTVGQIKAAYGTDQQIARGEQGWGFTITAPGGIIIGQLDGGSDNNKVRNIQAGNYCGPA